MITHDHLRALENSLTQPQRDRAFAIARANGWKAGEAPNWVWQQIFLEAKTYYAPLSPYDNPINNPSER